MAYSDRQIVGIDISGCPGESTAYVRRPMRKTLKDAMLDRMVKLSASIAALNTAADQLTKSSRQCDGKPMSDALIDIARRQRVRVLKMQGQLAALDVTFTERFGVDL